MDFGSVARTYDRVRPAYPADLVAAIASAAALRPGSRVLEIAPGTGQLSVPLAASGVDLTAVELDPRMAEVARERLAAFPRARVEVARFEDRAPSGEPFDLVVCATAFHWLDPAVRLGRCLDLLRPGGLLAVVGGVLLADADADAFGARLQGCITRWSSGSPGRPEGEDEIPVGAFDLGADPRAEVLPPRRFVWGREYTADGLADLFATFSTVLALDGGHREGLLRCIRSAVAAEPGGTVVRRHLADLQLARRV